VPTRKLDGFRGSAFRRPAIDTSTGRSSVAGFAQSSRRKKAFPIGWSQFCKLAARVFSRRIARSQRNPLKKRPLALRLEDWICDNIFDVAKQEGWFFAVTYYAVRDPRYLRAEVCWSESVKNWKKAKPIQYPSFEEWKASTAQCDETSHLTARERKARSSAKLVHPNRLAEAVASYMDYEALAYWARPALESSSLLPTDVAREIERRCPGYLPLRSTVSEQTSSHSAQGWERLMLWTGDHFFQDAKSEGWFDAILIQVRNHPRAIRTMEFADHCDKVWSSKLPEPYPPFADWRREADLYVELPG